MIRLVYSNQTEELAQALAATLSADDASRSSLFDPVHLVVPNRHVGDYIKFELARITGVAANIRTRSFAGLLDDVLLQSGLPFRIAEGPRLLGRVLRFLLDDAFLSAPVYEPIRKYVRAGGADPDVMDVRRLQLARELAQLFADYLATRPEMASSWPSLPTAPDGPNRTVEAWQRELFAAVFDHDGRGGHHRNVSAAGGFDALIPISQLLSTIPPEDLLLPLRVFVFGFSHLSSAQLTTMSALARDVELFVYAPNPCFEFWEDVEVGRAASTTVDTPALRLWGRAPRETIRRLNELSDGDHQPFFVDPIAKETSVLRQFQHDVLMRQPERQKVDDAFQFAGDSSIVLSACPTIRREAEAIAEEIWVLIKSNQETGEGASRLSFDDIAVVAPTASIAEYRRVLTAVFRECNAIPVTCPDRPVVDRSPIAEAVLLLLALPTSRFTRQDVLRLATHPCLYVRNDVEFDPAAWIRWCDDLGIVHGSNRRDHDSLYIDRDLYNWDQGLKRLALGVFMADENDGDDRPFVTESDGYAPRSVSLSERQSASHFVFVVRSLLAEARTALSSPRSMEAWGILFEQWVTRYLMPRDSKDQAYLASCRAAIGSLADMKGVGVPVSFRIARDIAQRAITNLTHSDRRGGVTIASMPLVRGIPFRIVFAVGLGDGQFPSSDRLRPLDVRNGNRLATEFGGREEGRALFLEVVMSVRDRLYLSYVARSERGAEDVAPSAIVREFRNVLAKGYLRDDERGYLEHTVAFHRFEDDGRASDAVRRNRMHPEARREARICALKRDWETHSPGTKPDLSTVHNALSPEAFALLSQMLAIAPIPPATAMGLDAPFHLSVFALRRFLECPLQGWARIALKLFEDEDDNTVAIEDEPFASARADSMPFLREVFWDSVRADRDVAMVYERAAAVRGFRGRAPTGIFSDVERTTHRGLLQTWRSFLDDAEPTVKSSGFRIHRFGRTESRGGFDISHEPLRIDVTMQSDDESPRCAQVVLSGITDTVVHGRASVNIGYQSATDTFRDERDFLRGFLDAVLLSAANVPVDPVFTVLLLRAGPKPALKVRRLRVPSSEQCRTYLSQVSGDLLTGIHAYYLPFEAVTRFYRGGGEHSLDACIDELRATGRTCCRYGPVPNAEVYPALPKARAMTYVERWYAPYFQSFEKEGK